MIDRKEKSVKQKLKKENGKTVHSNSCTRKIDIFIKIRTHHKL